jgi:Uma2 family endonuclease
MAALPYSRALTVDDLAALPDDGHRYELLDGSLVVTPAPHGRHQIAVIRLLHAFEAAATEELLVLVAPYEWRLANDTALQPDVLVIRRDDVGAYHSVAPLVVAEVLSPSTRSFDLLVKRERYEAAGVQAYWIVDPDAPAVTVWAQQQGAFVVVAAAEGEAEVVVDSPLPVRLRPSDLLR